MLESALTIIVTTSTVVLQIVKKVELEAQRAKGPNEAKGGRRRRNPVEDLKREVAIMRTLRHKNIVSLQVSLPVSCFHSCLPLLACHLLRVYVTVQCSTEAMLPLTMNPLACCDCTS